MNTETLRELLQAAPFQPFTVLMSNGKSYEVRHPEFAILMKSNLVVTDPETDRVWICPLLHIAGIETQQQTA
jgi:hypothetical protein